MANEFPDERELFLLERALLRWENEGGAATHESPIPPAVEHDPAHVRDRHADQPRRR